MIINIGILLYLIVLSFALGWATGNLEIMILKSKIKDLREKLENDE